MASKLFKIGNERSKNATMVCSLLLVPLELYLLLALPHLAQPLYRPNKRKILTHRAKTQHSSMLRAVISVDSTDHVSQVSPLIVQVCEDPSIDRRISTGSDKAPRQASHDDRSSLRWLCETSTSC